MKPKIKIFETDTLQKMFDDAKKEGYRIATLKETCDLIKSGKIENRWYDTSTVYIKGEVGDATAKELNNLKLAYANGALVVGLLLYQGLDVFGYGDLDDLGHGVGVLIRRKGK